MFIVVMCDSSLSISHCFMLVNNFFIFIFSCSFCSRKLLYDIMSFSFCQDVFSSFFEINFLSSPVTFASFDDEQLLLSFGRKKTIWNHVPDSSHWPNGERGIWTLAPVTRPTPLAGAPLQPLEYFSSECYYTRPF